MAWRWVEALELLDGSYFYFGSPSNAYNGASTWDQYIGGSGDAGERGRVEAARTLAYMDDRSNGADSHVTYADHRYVLKNGNVIQLEKTGYQTSGRVYIRIKDIYGNNKATSYAGSMNFDYYPLVCAILAVNDETEKAYIGELVYNKNTGTGYYRVIETIDQTNSASNLYQYLKGSFPSGGGGGNPYEGAGLNEDSAGGEDQNFDEVSDVILEPTLPTNPATGSGFVTAYVPTLSEINDVADYLIDPSVLQALAGTVLKLSDVVIGLSAFPFSITASGSKEIKINLCGAHLTTGVTCHYSNNQFVTLNMGSIDVKKYWDNCLDFDPFTSVSLYLPYIGYVDLDTDEVMGRTVQVKYNVDIFTGCCLALVLVNNSVLYQFPGECSCQIPITSVSFDSFLQSAIGLGIAAASGAESIKGGQALVDKATDSFMKASGRKQIFKAQENMWEAEAGLDAIKTSAHEQLALAGVSAVMSAKGQYSHAGAMSSCAGILGTQKPFLIIKRPKQCIPAGFESIRGFPCNMKKTLSDLSGYTEVGDIHLNIPNATVEEIVECERFLKGGVFL